MNRRKLESTLQRSDISAGRRAQSAGQLADIMAQQPACDVGMLMCIRAWRDLSTCRPIGMAVGPIPWTAIVDWCSWHNLDWDASNLVTHVVRRLDVDRGEQDAAQRALEGALGKGQR